MFQSLHLRRAVWRARRAILAVGGLYLLSAAVGMALALGGFPLAVQSRDSLVSQAQSSPVLVALDQNQRWQAGLLDFGGNLTGGVSTGLAGLGVLPSLPFIAYRGWVGGVVVLDGAHANRLADPAEALYYLSTLLLQLIPYTLSGGAGINAGLALYRPPEYYRSPTWLTMPKEALYDLLRIFLLCVPLFLFASLWEFLLR